VCIEHGYAIPVRLLPTLPLLVSRGERVLLVDGDPSVDGGATRSPVHE
jgi:hypothetical protein